jgi:hypothetical protein
LTKRCAPFRILPAPAAAESQTGPPMHDPPEISEAFFQNLWPYGAFSVRYNNNAAPSNGLQFSALMKVML